MPPRVVRLLHILLLAPVTALVAATVAPASAHAQNGPASAPAPYVVCIDPGHGGAPDNSDPSQLYDPGAIGVNGLQEKSVTLDLGLRLRDLLQQEGVTVAMTRTTDAYVSIDDREATCEQAGANLFVSIHLNYFTDASVNGSLVLYPNAQDQRFATTMATTLGKELAPYGVPTTGSQLRDDWWIHATMPTITVEGAFLTSPHDAAWLATASGREQLATAIRDGLQNYDPGLLRHKAAQAAWNASHPAAAAAGLTPVAAATSRGGPSALVLLLISGFVVGMAMRFPRLARVAARILVTTCVMSWRAGSWSMTQYTLRRGRRRRRKRARNLTGIRHHPARQRVRTRRGDSVYDELRL